MKQASGITASTGAILSSLATINGCLPLGFADTEVGGEEGLRVISGSRGNRLGRKSVLILVALILFTPALTGQEQNVYPTLDAQFEPLRAQFDHDSGKVRLLILLDPT